MKTATLVLGETGSMFVPIAIFSEFHEGLKFLLEKIEPGLKDGTFVGNDKNSLVDHFKKFAVNGNIVHYDVESYSNDSFSYTVGALFSHYYGGCGELNGLAVVELPIGVCQLFPFDLD